MKLILSFALALLAVGQIFAQSGRYLEPTFQVSRTRNIEYGSAIPNGATATAPLRLDWYQPVGDTMARRPVVFAFYGGSFIGGSTSASDIVAWCDSLTSRGYVSIAVGYRVGFNFFQQGAVVRAGYRALQDGRAAIRYVKEFADSMRIDTNQIFLLGNSAGAITALQIAYADDSNRPSESFGIPNSGTDTTDLGCMDCSGNTYAHTIDIKGVVGMWGAVLGLAGIDSSDRTAAIMFHGTDDTVVPVDSGNAFQNATAPMLYGSRLIHNNLLAIGLQSEVYVYQGQPHNFYYNSSTFPNAYWDSIRVPSINFLCRHTIGCDTSQIVELGVFQANENITFNVFPNPANERLQVVLPQAWATESNNILINIYNLQGQKVGVAPCLGDVTSVNTATLNSGFYVVELQHRDGRRAQQKFVIGK